ncbi:hypothetical protein [Nocardia thailandica]|uniref:hypothetical protein n=1 Tax=Nocardia thailandica TaxID=257275 RepID=UPI0002FCF1D2|nr:hypothetical protein [Nocardia thailandica]
MPYFYRYLHDPDWVIESEDPRPDLLDWAWWTEIPAPAKPKPAPVPPPAPESEPEPVGDSDEAPEPQPEPEAKPAAKSTAARRGAKAS